VLGLATTSASIRCLELLPDPARRSKRRFVAAYQARFGAGHVTSDPIEAAYVGVYLWAQSVRDAASSERAASIKPCCGQTASGPSGIVAVDGATAICGK